MRTGDAGTEEARCGNTAVAAWDEMTSPVLEVWPEMRPPGSLTESVRDFPGWWWCVLERAMGIKPMEEWGELPRSQRIRQYGRLIGQAEAMFKYHRESATWRNNDPVTVGVLEKMRPAMDPKGLIGVKSNYLTFGSVGRFVEGKDANELLFDHSQV